jgi:zinc transport system ATP-binding protein
VLVIRVVIHHLIGFLKANFVLDKVSFELQQGEFLTIIGPNGAGKSSLIKVLLGLIKADSGNIKRAKKLSKTIFPRRVRLIS